MSKKLFVGGLSWNTTNQTLQECFERFGVVAEARVIVDRETDRSRGFGFVVYEQPTDADAAIEAMNGAVLDGRTIRVHEAEERRPPPSQAAAPRRPSSPSAAPLAASAEAPPNGAPLRADLMRGQAPRGARVFSDADDEGPQRGKKGRDRRGSDGARGRVSRGADPWSDDTD